DAKPDSPWEPAKETAVPSEAIEAIKEIARAEGRAEALHGMPVVPPIVLPQQRTIDLPARPPAPSPSPGTTPIPSPQPGGDDAGTNPAPSPVPSLPKNEDRPQPQRRPRRGTKEGTRR